MTKLFRSKTSTTHFAVALSEVVIVTATSMGGEDGKMSVSVRLKNGIEADTEMTVDEYEAFLKAVDAAL